MTKKKLPENFMPKKKSCNAASTEKEKKKTDKAKRGVRDHN